MKIDLKPFAATLLAGVVPCALGEPPAPQQPLELVLVTASRGEALLRELPVAISQRDREAIDAAHPTFIGEVLNSVPGVHMTNLGNEQHSMSIRQPLSYNALYLYLLDGIPIRPLGLFNHNALYEINLAGVDSIEVVRGPAASLYGSNSVGGTVNFLTRAPGDGGAMLGLQGSDQGYRRLSVDASGRDGDAGIRVSAYGSRRDGGWQQYNDAEKDALTIRADWAAGAHTDITGVLTHNTLRTDMPGTLFATDYRQRPGASYQRFTYRDVEASLFSVAARGDWWAAGPTTVTLYGRDNQTRQLPDYLIFNDALDAGAASGRRNDNRFTSLGIDLRQQFDIGWLDGRLITGIGTEQTRNDYREQQLSIRRDPASGTYLDYTVLGPRRDYHVDLANSTFYSQLELSPLPSLRLVAGARYDHIEYDYRNRRQPGATSGAPSETRHFGHVSPRLGLSWSPVDSQTLFANWAQGFTSPEVSALYGSLDVPDLKESVFTNVELGWRARPDGLPLQLELAVYQLGGRDEVVNYRIAPGRSEPRNAGATRHRGIEFGLEWDVATEWQLALSGAWSRHTYRHYRTTPTLDYAGNEMPAAPRWLGTAVLRWQPLALPGLTVALEGTWLDDYWMNDANSVRYPGHALANLRASYRNGAWQFWLKGQNLGDRRYAEVAASSFSGSGPRDPDRQDTFTPGAPRTLSVGIEYHWGEP